MGNLDRCETGGTATNTIDGLEIRGNEIYDIGGVGGSIGLGISLHEVHSLNEGGGPLSRTIDLPIFMMVCGVVYPEWTVYRHPEWPSLLMKK